MGIGLGLTRDWFGTDEGLVWGGVGLAGDWFGNDVGLVRD